MSFPADPKRFPIRPSKDATYALSEMRVLKSAAGYYVGRTAWDEDDGYEEPGSRESGYFATEAEAAAALKAWDVGLDARNCSENAWAYATGHLPDPKEA